MRVNPDDVNILKLARGIAHAKVRAHMVAIPLPDITKEDFDALCDALCREPTVEEAQTFTHEIEMEYQSILFGR